MKRRSLFHLLLCLVFAGTECSALHLDLSVVFDRQDLLQVQQNRPFSATVGVDVVGSEVTISIPALTFTLIEEHSDIIPPQVYGFPYQTPIDYFPGAGGGYVYTKSGFIPKEYRPPSAIGVAVDVSSTLSTLTAVVTQDGNIRIALPRGMVFPIDGYFPIVSTDPITTDPVTISYTLPETSFTPPENFAISDGHTQTIYLQGLGVANQYLDLYFSDFYNGSIASYWMDNSTSSGFPYNAYGFARTGTVSREEGDLVVDQRDLNTAITPVSGYSCTQGGIAINPASPQNLVVNSLLLDPSGTLSPTLMLYRAFSTDGGTTWSAAGRVDTNFGLPDIAGGDNNALFDQFGNYWIGYFSEVGGQQTLTIALSGDGGVTFREVVTLNPVDYGATMGSVFDFNQMAFGGDGNGGWALYFICDLIVGSDLVPCMGYIEVPGAISNSDPVPTDFYFMVMNSLANQFALGTIAASDSGKIFINYETLYDCSGATYEGYYLFYKPDGINNFVDGSLSGPTFWAESNLGVIAEAHPGLGSTYSAVNSKAIRGQFPVYPIRALAYDNTQSALYGLVYTSDPIYSQNCTLYLVASIDNGSTWSQPYFVKDTSLGNCHEASIKSDPVTGDAFVTWYDSRADLTANQYLEFYGAVIPSEDLAELISSL